MTFFNIVRIFLISLLFSCNKKQEVKVLMITEYHKFDGSFLKYKDSIFIKNIGSFDQIEISNEQKRDTIFEVSTNDSLIYLGKNKKLLSHSLIQKKMVISNINSSFFSPYLCKNSILDETKEFIVKGRKLLIYRFLENTLDKNDEKGYSYYLPKVGFIAFINTRSEYYSIVKEIKNNPNLSSQELNQLTSLMLKDSIFFINRRVIPPFPQEFQ
jgi:hypothetical protein